VLTGHAQRLLGVVAGLVVVARLLVGEGEAHEAVHRGAFESHLAGEGEGLAVDSNRSVEMRQFSVGGGDRVCGRLRR
jgi:hypothetical protein